jgi:hypothetical protein
MKRYENCCCFSARTGVLVLASLGITGGIIGIIQDCLIASNGTLMSMGRDETIIYGIGFAISILNTLFNGSMMYGVVTNKSGFLKPWLVFTMIGLIMIGVATLVGFVWMLVEGEFMIAAVILIIGILTGCLNFYFWTVVLSVYHDIQEDKYVNQAGHDLEARHTRAWECDYM